MNDATLHAFRQIAVAMAGDTPQTWEWVGPHASQRMFGITQERAEKFARQFGGVARRMEVTP